MAERRRRRRFRGNLITERLRELLEQDGRGATDRLAARLQVLSRLPGYEALRRIRPNALTELLNDQHVVPDRLLVAMAMVASPTGRPVDLYWLLGLRDSPIPPQDVHWPGEDGDARASSPNKPADDDADSEE
jgi:hypothetical protein